MIPGSNLLNTALTAIARQMVIYQRYLGRADNEIGQDVSAYEEPGVAILGSFQAVKRNLYAQYGLDLSKYYANFYVSKNALPVDRNVSGDQLVYDGTLFKAESETDWFAIDGWVCMLLVKIDDEG